MRFESIWTIGYAMTRNGFEQLQVELLPEALALVSLEAYEWLECFQELNGSLKANFSWLEAMLAGGLGYDGTNEVVSQNVSPDFFANKFG